MTERIREQGEWRGSESRKKEKEEETRTFPDDVSSGLCSFFPSETSRALNSFLLPLFHASFILCAYLGMDMLYRKCSAPASASFTLVSRNGRTRSLRASTGCAQDSSISNERKLRIAKSHSRYETELFTRRECRCRAATRNV